jgi:GNAT superfamily N-acetyltransferase
MPRSTTKFDIRPITDRPFLDELLRLRWSGGSLIVHDKVIAPADVEALAAYDGNRLAGVATWRLDEGVLTMFTLNNISEQRGVGVALLEAMMALGRDNGAPLIRVVVTNDNLNALGFYQRRGFRITAIYPGAVDATRAMNPNVPLIGANRIPIRDEIELERTL